ncbi:MAG: sensor histidine kinase [Rikenellaceae bacterium]|jgi:signal transduction histidine kinase|nr:sensor histidine kinase [Rikenellaceae bacterium]MBR6496381.1 sensor histidine kinase [Rikenellaceae bacterium]
MILKVLFIVSILFQLVAAVVAIRLIRATKYNASWILISVALALMAITRIGEFVRHIMGKDWPLSQEVMVWIGILISACFTIGIFMIPKILNYIFQMEHQKRISAERIINIVIHTEERERMRFSKDIHDGLGPLLSSAKMSVSALAGTELSKEQKEIIDNTNLVIDEAVKSLKHISNNISPHILNNFGLERAIENFIKKFESISDLKINFKSNMKNVRLKNNIEVILYRIVCEMINNTIKHSRASEANVSLILNGGVLTLDYSDNGCGFIVENALENSSGMGLSNIISRVESIKGEVKIDSNLGQGARFVIKINGVK